jgi:acetyl esterase/lipase
LIQVGGNEVLLDDATRLAKKLRKADVDVHLEVWEKMFHVWHYLGGIIPEANDAIRAIGHFVKDVHHAQGLSPIPSGKSSRALKIKSA